MPYDLSLQNLPPFKNDLTIFKERNIFIVNMNFRDSNSSYREKMNYCKISLDPSTVKQPEIIIVFCF